MHQRTYLLCLILSVCFAGNLPAQIFLTPQIDSIPMRDGKKLAADVFLPAGTQVRPTILVQTPYNRIAYRFNLPLNVQLDLDSSPYNFVTVDWRGFFGSLGAFSLDADRGEDGYDVVEWIAAQPWSDGQVATWGPSALGVVQFQTMREQPPHLVCAIPMVAEPQFSYDEYYPGGVLRTEYVEQLDGLGFGIGALVGANPVYNNVWAFVENSSFYPERIQVPVFMQGGWYDHNIEASLPFFTALQQQSAPSVRDQHHFLIGPWAHGGFGDTRPGTINQGELSFPEAEGWGDSLALRFLAYHLLDSANAWEQQAPVQYFQMGDQGWWETESWPPPGQTQNWFLHGDSSLQLAPSSNGSLNFQANPRDPSPTYGGMTLRQDLLQGPYDQRDTVESRSDLLLFTSEPLGQAVRVQGQIEVRLFVSTDRPDADVAVRLTNVYPDGRSVLLADDILRLRFREGFTAGDTSAVVPGEVYEISLLLSDLAHTFLPGHRIRLSISGSNYPRYDLNLHHGGPMYTAGDSLVATTSLHLGPNLLSRLVFPTPISSSRAAPLTPLPLSLHPNPAQDSWTVDGESSEPVEIQLRDLQGRLMQEISGRFPVEMQRNELAPGIYFLQVRQGEARSTRSLWLR
ncbi:MAG: CocE/NonD family hydrolase [Bacteroidota bacterium]